MHRYAKVHFLPSTFEVHWLSIINGVVLVILLMIFLSYILVRALNKDNAHAVALQSKAKGAGDGGGAGGSGNAGGDDAGLGELDEESGWRLLKDQVFRVPEAASWLSAIVGAGMQLLISCLSLLALALLGAFHPTVRGAVPTAFLVVYCFSGGIGGYVSGSLYKQLGEDAKSRSSGYDALPTTTAKSKKRGDATSATPGEARAWFFNSLRTLFVFLLPSCAVFSVQNTMAWARASTSAIPARSLIVVLLLFLFVCAPLTIVGVSTQAKWG